MVKSVLLISMLWFGTWSKEYISAGTWSMFPVARSETAGAVMAQESTSAHPALAQGVLLIAGKNLVDPVFERTVVLITEYNANGTIGLVLNRRTNIPPGNALPQLGDLAADRKSVV